MFGIKKKLGENIANALIKFFMSILLFKIIIDIEITNKTNSVNEDNAKKESIEDTDIENKFDKYLIIWRKFEEKGRKIIKDVFEFLDN